MSKGMMDLSPETPYLGRKSLFHLYSPGPVLA